MTILQYQRPVTAIKAGDVYIEDSCEYELRTSRGAVAMSFDSEISAREWARENNQKPGAPSLFLVQVSTIKRVRIIENV